MSNKNLCWATKENKCAILKDKNCDKCSFFKTKSDYTTENDNAILNCREKGICDSCKYQNGKSKCKLSYEVNQFLQVYAA